MPTPTSRRRLGWIVLPTLLVLLQLWGGTISWAQQAVRVVAAGATDGQARLVVDPRDTAASALPPQSFSVTADGQSQPARLVVDLAGALADVIERIAAAEGLSAEDVANVLFFGEDAGRRYRVRGSCYGPPRVIPAEASVIRGGVEVSCFSRGARGGSCPGRRSRSWPRDTAG